MAEAARLCWRAGPLQVVLIVAMDAASGAGAGIQLRLTRSLLGSISRGGHGLSAGAASAVVGLIVVAGVLGIARHFATEAADVLGERVRRIATVEMATAVAGLPLVAFEQAGLYDRISRARVFGGFQASQVVSHASTFLGAALTAMGIAITLLAISPAFVAVGVVLASLPIAIAVTRANRDSQRTLRRLTPAERRRDYYAGLLTERSSAAEIRAFGLEQFFSSRLADAATNVQSEHVALARRTRILNLGSEVVGLCFQVAVVVALLFLVSDHKIDLAIAVTLLLGLLQLRAAVIVSVRAFADLLQVCSFFSDYSGLVGKPNNGATAKHEIPKPFQTIVLRNATFSYPHSSVPVVREVSLELARGRVVALVGANGSGKTTVARLLAGLFRPTAGEVLYNGVSLELLGEAIRDHICLLSQDFARYALTVSENIGSGRISHMNDEERLSRAAAQLDIASFTDSLPEGMNTLLSREFGGEDISVGQWQRVAIARALFRDASVLVLDEPSASLDPKAEALSYASARELFADRAILLISHRLAAVRESDFIYVLDDGCIIESGNHDELMAANGEYASMFNLQASGYVDVDA